MTGPKHKRTYVGWVNSLGDIMIGGYDHDTIQVLPEVTIKVVFSFLTGVNKIKRASYKSTVKT